MISYIQKAHPTYANIINKCRELICRLGDPPIQHSYTNQAADVLAREEALSTDYDHVRKYEVSPLFME